MTKYVLVGEPGPGHGQPSKILKVATFMDEMGASVETNLRIYFVEDTVDAIEVLIIIIIITLKFLNCLS